MSGILVKIELQPFGMTARIFVDALKLSEESFKLSHGFVIDISVVVFQYTEQQFVFRIAFFHLIHLACHFYLQEYPIRLNGILLHFNLTQ
jgi:hypothetical protein